jgi:hypothetical protein
MFKDKNNNYRLKIAFDFDDTLTEPFIKEFAKGLILKGHDVWIMTARSDDDNDYITQIEDFEIITRNADILEVAQELGIPDKIIFTNFADKSAAFKAHGFDLLFDDDAAWHCNPICEQGGIAVNI